MPQFRTVPVPIDALLEYGKRLHVRYEWFPDRAAPEVPRGRLYVYERRRVIVLSPEVRPDPMRYRYALAHELGHLTTASYGGSLRDDAWADRWAEGALLPVWWIERNRHLGVGEMADEAGVYQWMVAARLQTLRDVFLHAK